MNNQLTDQTTDYITTGASTGFSQAVSINPGYCSICSKPTYWAGSPFGTFDICKGHPEKPKLPSMFSVSHEFNGIAWNVIPDRLDIVRATYEIIKRLGNFA